MDSRGFQIDKAIIGHGGRAKACARDPLSPVPGGEGWGEGLLPLRILDCGLRIEEAPRPCPLP